MIRIPPRWQSAAADWPVTVFLVGGKWIDSVLQRVVSADIVPEGFWLKNNRIRAVGLAAMFQNRILKYLKFMQY